MTATRTFTNAFDARLKAGACNHSTGVSVSEHQCFRRSFIQSIGQECLDRFVAFGEST